MTNTAREGQSIPPINPTFTQAQADAGELPAVGSEVVYNTASHGDVVGIVTGYRTEKSRNTLADNPDYRVFVTFEHNQRFLSDIKPIQTAEDRLKTALVDIIWDGTCLEAKGFIGDDIDKVLDSDKFTITLKG
jgi:hypothetical protein